jgi:phosphohistidine phosphatase
LFFLFFTFPGRFMKSLILVRHAKSSWDDPSQSDYDRPLNDRGRKDAPMMAKRLVAKGIRSDALVSSPAIRAFTTAQAFAAAMDIPKHLLHTAGPLYMAGPADFFRVIASLDDGVGTAALFSHNPGITDFANLLGVARIDHFPTCSVLGIHADTAHWKDFETARKSFWFFDFPKNQGG